MGPVRVCHVITRLDLGGAQENTLYTVAHLGAPFRPSLVCGEGGILDEEARRIPGVNVTFVPSLVRDIRPHRDLAALRRLARILRRDRPAIVHTHSSKAGILGRLAARLAGVPIAIHTIHGFGFHEGQPAALRSLLVGLERAVAPLTTHFIVVSRANLEEGAALGIVPRGRATLIRSGVRIAEFEAAARDPALRDGRGLRRELGLPDGVPLIGMVACLKPQKSPLDFVEVAARVAAAEQRAVFVLAGDGELRARVEARARALGLDGRLHLLGWRRDIPRIMAALDVLVLTSLWEGLPRVIPEAIAAGVPVVATAIDGTADVLRDGETGLVRPARDVEGLAAGVGRLLRDRPFARALAARARSILPEFDIDVMVRSQESLYHRLVMERSPGDEASR
jgi:glycosyltransferase involved in cell wall biosynthesis